MQESVTQKSQVPQISQIPLPERLPKNADKNYLNDLVKKFLSQYPYDSDEYYDALKALSHFIVHKKMNAEFEKNECFKLLCTALGYSEQRQIIKEIILEHIEKIIVEKGDLGFVDRARIFGVFGSENKYETLFSCAIKAGQLGAASILAKLRGLILTENTEGYSRLLDIVHSSRNPYLVKFFVSMCDWDIIPKFIDKTSDNLLFFKATLEETLEINMYFDYKSYLPLLDFFQRSNNFEIVRLLVQSFRLLCNNDKQVDYDKIINPLYGNGALKTALANRNFERTKFLIGCGFCLDGNLLNLTGKGWILFCHYFASAKIPFLAISHLLNDDLSDSSKRKLKVLEDTIVRYHYQRMLKVREKSLEITLLHKLPVELLFTVANYMRDNSPNFRNMDDNIDNILNLAQSAVLNNNLDAIKLLLKEEGQLIISYSDPKFLLSLLHLAASHDSLEIIQLLVKISQSIYFLDNDLPVEGRSIPNEHLESYSNVLSLFVEKNNIECVRLLLDAGIPQCHNFLSAKEFSDNTGSTEYPHCLAAFWKNPEGQRQAEIAVTTDQQPTAVIPDTAAVVISKDNSQDKFLSPNPKK